MSLAKQCPMCGRYPAIEEGVDNTGLYAVCRYELCGLYGRMFRLDEWNARPLEDEKKAPSTPKVEYNLKVKSSIGFCSEHAAKLINNLANAAWYYGHSCSFENYTAQIEADAALCDFIARLERREKDLNELVEIVLEVSKYHANMWNEKALLAWRALEKFLNEERQ